MATVSRLLGVRFEVPVPPPAPSDVAGWFGAAPGLYLHVPFCTTICPFCPYNKVRYVSEQAPRYLEDLEREVTMYLDVFSGPFPSLYVGGGTPTLCLGALRGVLGRLPITGERAIEVLPAHMTPEGAGRLLDLGFDYVSLGVQSFDAEVLRRLRRRGSPEQNREAVEAAVGRFACIDIDLIFDSVFDDPEILLSDLQVCFAYGVDQVSTYPLMRFGYTPFGKVAHDRSTEHALLREATELARSNGYERRSVWTFNRVGSPAYTSITRPFYLGIGAGAASFGGSVFAVDHFGLAQYHEALSEGRLPIARVARLRRPAAAAYRWFWQAYTGAIPIGSGDPLLAHPVSITLRDLLMLFGLAHRKDGAVALTELGYDRYHDLERWVTYHLIEPLWAEMMEEHATAGVS